MTDLSHWDFAETFHIEEAAELIVGGNPDAVLGLRSKKITFSTAAKPVFNRMHEASVAAMLAMKGGQNCPPEGLMFLELERIAVGSKPRTLLLSILDTMISTGEEYRVRRAEIARWLSAIGMKSVYQFGRSNDSTEPTTIVQTDQDIDPSDLPVELDAANTAYRAVLNGHGDKNDTFKNRLIDFLQTNNKDLKPEAVQRIATVANPDKTAGRKKSAKE